MTAALFEFESVSVVSSQVVRLQGGIIPLYAAMGVEESGEVIGLGYTPEAAARAPTLGTR